MTANLKNQIIVDQLTKVSNTEDCFVSYPLSLIPKSYGKYGWIYHLSYLRDYSINCCYIQKKKDVFEYIIFDKVKPEVIQAGLDNTMVKRDLTDTFYHIPIGLQD